FINNQVYKAGSILSMHPFDPATIEIIYTAKDRTKVDSVSALKSKLVLKITDKNLNSKIYEAIKGTDGWLMGAVNFPVVGTMDLVTAEDSRDDYMVSHEGPLNPVKLYYVSPEVALPKIIKET